VAALGLLAACSSTTSTVSPAPVTSSTAGNSATLKAESGSHQYSFTVDGVTRTAIVVFPGSAKPAPVVFVFHGHGGSAATAQRRFAVDKLWPDAIVVYPQGLAGHKGETDPTGVKSGWQNIEGEAGDRDIHFFDAVLAQLRATGRVDDQRISVMGHSNGAAFAALLWHERGADLAAIATMSSQPRPLDIATDPARSMFMSMGRTDPIVPFANQQRAIRPAERRLGIDPSKSSVSGDLRVEHGRENTELDIYQYAGGHEPPAAVPGLIVAFLQRHTLASG
jgi:polyhydroxybutyrate depolymerase